MEDIYNSYLTGKEREEAIEESSMELLFNKLDMMYEMADMEYQNDIQSAEFKVLKESGTYDDLQYLVEVATEENTEKKKGILKSLIEAIANIFKKISDAMHKFVIKGNDDEEADVPDDFIKKHNAIMDFWNKWRNAIPNIVKGEKQTGDGIIAAIESVLALGAAGVGTAVVTRKIKLSKMKEYKNNEETVNEGMSRIVNTTQNALVILDNSTPNNQDNSDGKSKNGILDFIKKILGKLKDFANFVKNTFNQLVNIIKTKFKSTKSDKADNNDSDNTSENNNEQQETQQNNDNGTENNSSANNSESNTNNTKPNETKTNNSSNTQNNQTVKNQAQAQNENKPTQTQNNQSQNNNQNQQPVQQQTQTDNNQQPQQPENNSKKTIVFTKMYGNNLSENDIGKEYKLKVKSGKKNKWQKQGIITKDMINNKTLAGKQVKVGNYQESTELDDIFGLNLISEMAQYEANETDKDMKELSNLFESLF